MFHKRFCWFIYFDILILVWKFIFEILKYFFRRNIYLFCNCYEIIIIMNKFLQIVSECSLITEIRNIPFRGWKTLSQLGGSPHHFFYFFQNFIDWYLLQLWTDIHKVFKNYFLEPRKGKQIWNGLPLLGQRHPPLL